MQSTALLHGIGGLFADSLHATFLYRHAEFYVVTSKEVVASLKLSTESLPAVFMVSNEGEGILRYSGEILELNLSEWVLRFSSPAMGELSVDSTQGLTFVFVLVLQTCESLILTFVLV